MKTRAEMVNDEPGSACVHDSKVDHFDKRLALLRMAFVKHPDDPELKELEKQNRCVSMYEFYWKNYVTRNRIKASDRDGCILVTPAYSSDCANVTHPRHEDYARMCVVADWRHMPTAERHELIHAQMPGAVDPLLYGGTVFEAPLAHAAAPVLDRYLGAFDLVLKFDGH